MTFIFSHYDCHRKRYSCLYNWLFIMTNYGQQKVMSRYENRMRTVVFSEIVVLNLFVLCCWWIILRTVTSTCNCYLRRGNWQHSLHITLKFTICRQSPCGATAWGFLNRRKYLNFARGVQKIACKVRTHFAMSTCHLYVEKFGKFRSYIQSQHKWRTRKL